MPAHPCKLALSAVIVAAIMAMHVRLAGASTIDVDHEICDVSADASLGSEDYSRAIDLHQSVLAADAKNALAHYHLGFAYGMVGHHEEELTEYRRAVELGLRQWDLYLNLGRLYLEGHDYSAAIEALAIAESLEPKRSEIHFNLGLAYERQHRLMEAEQEMRTALRLGADPADAGNMLAVICAEEGKQTVARNIWTDLAHDASSAKVARANLALLDQLVSPPGGRAEELSTMSARKDLAMGMESEVPK